MFNGYDAKHLHCITGTALVFVSFPLIFSFCPMCKNGPYWWHIVYLGFVVLLFQLGWAIVQITHLAIIPEMSRTRKDRADLTALRYSASVVSNVVVFMVTWAVLHVNRRKTDDNTIGPDDAYRFRVSVLVVCSVCCLLNAKNFPFSITGYLVDTHHSRHHHDRAVSILAVHQWLRYTTTPSARLPTQIDAIKTRRWWRIATAGRRRYTTAKKFLQILVTLSECIAVRVLAIVYDNCLSIHTAVARWTIVHIVACEAHVIATFRCRRRRQR